MTFFDSNILTYFIENDASYGVAAAKAMAGAIEESEACFSVLALAELTAKPLSQAQTAKLNTLLKLVRVVDLDRAIALSTGSIRQSKSVTLPDAIHLATALEHKASLFVTNDLRLTKLRLPGLKIVSLADLRRLP